MQIQILVKTPAVRFPTPKPAGEELLATFQVLEAVDTNDQEALNDDLLMWMSANLDRNSSDDDGEYIAKTEDGQVVAQATWDAKAECESENAQW